ncbi:hypothetical protein FZEAL_9641 [Fusarium zealandicum]|uniref:Wax synthase domain-containing protein n=1 Tax=Fusarium zealandicum TaxID=1053134 RepID=A0A8H4U9H2_9HYPO|nr:hypothetical protein FZEAL_9641 [Fusarium zealandicum]
MAIALSPDLGDIARVEYKRAFERAVAEGTRSPLILPYSLLVPFLVPHLYLAIPHRNRPWLYRSRWLIVAFVLIFDANIIRNMSSMNVACAYSTGLMGVWGILMTLDLLVWNRPQFDYARVIKVDRKKEEKLLNGTSENHIDKLNGSHRENGLQRRKPSTIVGTSSEGVKGDSDHSNLDNSHYVWQTFPENGSLGERLNWTFDLATNFRKIGWNYATTSVSGPIIPEKIIGGDAVSLDDIPVVSRSGYRCSLTQAEFVWTRIRNFAVVYVILDACAVLMVKDPYFIYGLDHGLELPQLLQQLPPWLLLVYREVLTLAGIYAAIQAIFNLHDLFQCYVFSYLYPIRGELWQYSSTFGSFSQVFDRGLAGWWGSWWHQTFRLQFIAPAAYLVRHGYLTKRTVVAQVVTMYISFFQSGLLHAAGSVSCMRTTKTWRALVFFLLQPPGIIVQLLLNHGIDMLFPDTPRNLRQAFNLVFCLAWLQLTTPPLANDFASAGLWLLEPVPISPLRWLGWGHPNDHWWRLNRDILPKWHSDEHWWKSGLQL